jgi:hypothetical protein
MTVQYSPQLSGFELFVQVPGERLVELDMDAVIFIEVD